jgi:excinuclease UvrABC ATPase subunit
MASRTRKQASGKASSTKSRTRRPRPKSKPELVIKTKISPNLAWIYPYLRRAKLKMPNLVLPDRIRSTKPSKARIMRVMGNAYVHNKTIVIATHNQLTYMNKKGELKVRRITRMPKAKMLDTLAHEMAHLHYPKHGYEHEEFTRAIFKTFDLTEKCPQCKGSGKIPMEGSY